MAGLRLTAFACSLAFAAAAATAPPALAQGYTAQQQAACQADAQIFCGQFIPDHELIRRCLARNKARISPACRALFTGQRVRPR